jgi:hypothetical protein
LLLLAPSCGDQLPEVPPPPSEFIHFVDPDHSDSPGLQTAVTTYLGPEGQTVDLISALHIADPAHYEELQELFTSYDALLYEMVAEEGTRPSPERRAGGILSGLQRGMTNALDLEFQLDGVDYSPENFVHADLDPDSFARLMEERGESIFSLLLQAMATEFQRAREASEDRPRTMRPMDLITAFQNREGRHLLRLTFAGQMTDIENVVAGLRGKDGESVLLEGRNKRALQVLQEQLTSGRKKLGIYYGGAHMPDFERRLLALGYTKTGERWLTAWDLRKRPDSVAPRYRKDGEGKQ